MEENRKDCFTIQKEKMAMQEHMAKQPLQVFSERCNMTEPVSEATFSDKFHVVIEKLNLSVAVLNQANASLDNNNREASKMADPACHFHAIEIAVMLADEVLSLSNQLQRNLR